jgi:NAD(P)-dependent dehydrogenase (short-subunit alcohol dehydrogenase family)
VTVAGQWARPLASPGDTLPVRRVVQPEDVAALAVHVVTNTALTGSILDVDGGRQLV